MRRHRNCFFKGRIIEGFLLLNLIVILVVFFAADVLAKREDDFRKYINIDDYQYKNVLVLGVDAKWEQALELLKKYHFDLVIPVSREGSLSAEDWARASIAKLGLPTARLEEIEGKNIKNLFAHSWGSSEVINAISQGRIPKVKNLHLMGSPHSALSSNLNESINKGVVNKVDFHINEGDDIVKLRNFPSGLGGGFNPKINFHFYTKKRNSIDTEYVAPKVKVPIFNVELGFGKYIHYNRPEDGHGVINYLENGISGYIEDAERSAFQSGIHPPVSVTSSEGHAYGMQKQFLHRFLTDIPGVGWRGGARENDWGNLLNQDKITIYIRHQGPGWDKWDKPKEPNAIVVTLPNKWDEKTAKELLLPYINTAISQGKDIHFVIDKNVTFLRHILPFSKQAEDKWAANVADCISKNMPANYGGILAEHSRGTPTNRYINDFSRYERIIVASPRGDDALSWINKTPNLPPTDIITGLSDALNWRLTQRYGNLIKENPNVRIIQLRDIAGPGTTHSRLQNLGTEGNWKIITGAGSQNFKGSLQDIVTYSSNAKFPNLNISHDDPTKKYYKRDDKYFPPPGCPPFCGDGGGGAAVPVGGVYLDMPADIVGLNTAEVSGAIWEDRKKQLSLIVKGDVVAFPKTYLDDFISILMTVYGGEDPGISIDPGGYTDQCAVRYIGKVKNTRFGRTLFEADRLLKSLSLGKDTLTGYPINPGIPGFKTMVQLFEEKGMKYSGALYRFWFLPLEMKIKQQGSSFVFDSARLQVKSEYMFKKGKRSETEPAAEEFAKFLTEHYNEFASRYPVLKNLVEYAKMVSIAEWLKERNVPLNWFLIANSFTENIPTPDVTPAMFSDHPQYPFSVWGGVDFRMTNDYLPVTGLSPVISEAAASKYTMQVADLPMWNVGDTSWSVSGTSPGKKFEVKDEVYTAVGMSSSTMLNNGRKLAFQTDAVMHNSPRLELTRYFNADNPVPSEFGWGWSLLVPYKLEPTDDKRVTYQDVSLPERMTVIDLINNKKELLKFESKKYINVGYFPEKPGQFKGLLLLSDASFLLVDRWDNSFHFDQSGRLIVADMGKENKWIYVYGGDKIIGVVNKEGSEIGFEYDQNGRIVKAIISNKGMVKGEINYVYDTKSDLVKVIGLDGKVTEYQYNNSHMLLSLIPSHTGWKVWQYVVVSLLSLIFGMGVLLTYKKIRRKES